MITRLAVRFLVWSSASACATLSDVPWPDSRDSGAGDTSATAEVSSEIAAPTDTLVGTNPDIGKTPPSAKWLAPKDGAIVSLGQEVTFTADVSSPFVAAADLMISATLTTGSLPGFVQPKADASGKVTFTTTLLPPGPVTVVLRVLDGGNPATQIALSLYVDSPPGTPEVAITPAKPGGNDDLTVQVTAPGADVDLGQTATQTYLYEWRANDLPTDVTGAIVPASKTLAGQVWAVSVRAFDGFAAGPPGIAWVTIGNTPPVLPKLAVQPDKPTVADTLVCGMPTPATDVDGQDLAFKASWTKNGKPWAEAGHKGTLKLAQFVAGKDGKPGAFQQLLAVVAGDTVQCHMLVSDGADIAGPATSTEVALAAFDGCQHTEAPCALSANCTPTQTAEVTCACKQGFVGDGKACTDENECLTGSNACDPAADCTNVFGSYTCGCPSGWNGDGFSCVDINECATATANSCDLSADCSNSVGGYDCVCKAGWVANGQGGCVDQDACKLGLLVCDPHATCVNLPGPDTCTCDLGWAATLTTAGAAACVDLNECATPTATGLPACVTGAICTNFSGGYDCTCGPGWQGDGTTCSNVDECKAGLFVCSAVATCQDLDGDYLCVCGPGYIGDGKLCDDVDECAAAVSPCDAKATCTNKPGGFDCACKPGFGGDGKTCKAVIE